MSICLHMTQREECLHCLRAELSSVREALELLTEWARNQPCTCEADGESVCARCTVLGVGA